MCFRVDGFHLKDMVYFFGGGFLVAGHSCDVGDPILQEFAGGRVLFFRYILERFINVAWECKGDDFCFFCIHTYMIADIFYFCQVETPQEPPLPPLSGGRIYSIFVKLKRFPRSAIRDTREAIRGERWEQPES